MYRKYYLMIAGLFGLVAVVLSSSAILMNQATVYAGKMGIRSVHDYASGVMASAIEEMAVTLPEESNPPVAASAVGPGIVQGASTNSDKSDNKKENLATGQVKGEKDHKKRCKFYKKYCPVKPKPPVVPLPEPVDPPIPIDPPVCPPCGPATTDSLTIYCPMRMTQSYLCAAL